MIEDYIYMHLTVPIVCLNSLLISTFNLTWYSCHLFTAKRVTLLSWLRRSRFSLTSFHWQESGINIFWSFNSIRFFSRVWQNWAIFFLDESPAALLVEGNSWKKTCRSCATLCVAVIEENFKESKVAFSTQCPLHAQLSSEALGWRVRKHPRRRRQRERHKTKGLTSKPMTALVCYNFWYISLPFSAKQRREMIKSKVLLRT